MNLELNLISDKDIIRINKRTAKYLKIGSLYLTVARFGLKVTDVVIEIDLKVPNDEIQIASNVLETLKIPKCNAYLIRVENKELVFGPYIGIYIGMGQRNRWKYERLASFVKDYKNILGAVCAFREEDINFSSMEVDAYIYDSLNDVWHREMVPLPSAVHLYGGIRKKTKGILKGIYGDRLFNYNEMDKWTEMSVLKANSSTRKYIPDTEVCTSLDDFRSFMARHTEVYFKPIKGRQGQGIHKITKKQNGTYILSVQKSKTTKDEIFKTIDDLADRLQEYIESKDFLLQQSVNITYDKRIIDYRIRFDKNMDNEWIQSLFVARVSSPGGIVSNRSAGGEGVSPEIALQKYHKYSKRKAKRIKRQMERAGLELTKAVEEYNLNYGKCAVDLGLDNKGRIWHFESNIRNPNDYTSKSFEQTKGIDRVGSLNMQYLKRLAGFKNANISIRQYRNASLNQNIGKYKLFIAGDIIEFINNVNFEKELKRYSDFVQIISTKRTYILLNVELGYKSLLNLILYIRRLDKSNLIRSYLYKDTR